MAFTLNSRTWKARTFDCRTLSALGAAGGATTGPTLYGLAGTCAASIDNSIAGLTPSVAIPGYSSIDHATPIYVRNLDCWTEGASLNTRPFPVWANGSISPGRGGGCLVAPDVLILAQHQSTEIPDGSQFRWVAADNSVQTRTMTSSLNPAGDIRVGILNSPLPGSIGFCKVLPKTWPAYLWRVFQDSGEAGNAIIAGTAYGVPVLYITQDEDVLVAEWFLDPSDSHLATCFKPPFDSVRASFYETLVGGDSGHACCLVVVSELVLLFTHDGVGPSGTMITDYLDETNAAMTTLGSTHQLTQFDLSPYEVLEPEINWVVPAMPNEWASQNWAGIWTSRQMPIGWTA